jgi:nickel-dependent lactate racemase
MASPTLSLTAPDGQHLAPDAVRDLIAQACPAKDYKGKKVLLIVPDATRTCPLGLLFQGLFAQIGAVTSAFDVMIALGTHQPMSEEAICHRLEITGEERGSTFRGVRFFNHEWDNPGALRKIGDLTLEKTRELTGGLFEMEVPVNVNARVFDYDQIIICGPVFPHEVVGFSGGNKYLFPGVSGPEVLNFFHWLGALVTNPLIIGNKWTPVRKVVDYVGSLVPVPKLCLCMVVEKAQLAGLFIGSPEAAWDEASELSKKLHITYKDHPYHTILSCAPTMYDEIWVGAKCMYKLEPVIADGGELIIYAPHIHEISVTHGHHIRQVGYHCVEYFNKQWDKFKHIPWGTLAHSTHVAGIGTYENGEVNLGYRDPATIDPASYANREDEGVLLVPKAGEMLFHLKDRPHWCREM